MILRKDAENSMEVQKKIGTRTLISKIKKLKFLKNIIKKNGLEKIIFTGRITGKQSSGKQ